MITGYRPTLNVVRLLPILSTAAISIGCRTPPAPLHPLAPLTAGEIRAAARIIQASGMVPRRARFSLVALDEPPKELVLRKIGIPRRAFAVIYDDQANRTWEAAVDLAAARVDLWKEIPGAQPQTLTGLPSSVV